MGKYVECFKVKFFNDFVNQKSYSEALPFWSLCCCSPASILGPTILNQRSQGVRTTASGKAVLSPTMALLLWPLSWNVFFSLLRIDFLYLVQASISSPVFNLRASLATLFTILLDYTRTKLFDNCKKKKKFVI